MLLTLPPVHGLVAVHTITMGRCLRSGGVFPPEGQYRRTEEWFQKSRMTKSM